jgi:hypothetical protein
MRQSLTSRCNVLQTQAISDPTSPLRIINTSIWDIEIHYYLTNPTLHTQPTIPTSLSWNPLTSSTDHDLLQYCKLHPYTLLHSTNTLKVHTVASHSITAVSPSSGSPNLREVLLRVALSRGTQSSTAVLKSLLALSSLHRHGLQQHAARLKVSALSALAEAAKVGVEGKETIAHIAALMLLCCFEV